MDPGAVVDRYQAVTLRMRALGLGEPSQDAATQPFSFRSAGPVPSWAQGAVVLVAHLGLVHGTGGGSFGGTQDLTRADAAVMLASSYDLRGRVLRGVGAGSAGANACSGLKVSGFTPPSGPPGTTVTIFGSGFGSSQGQVLLSDGYSGWDSAPIQSWSDTKIVVTAPTTPPDAVSAGKATSPAGPTAIAVEGCGGYVEAAQTFLER